MADADEEIPVPVSQRPGDVDLSDETQDFRFLNSLATYLSPGLQQCHCH